MAKSDLNLSRRVNFAETVDILLNAGEKVPGDGLVFESTKLAVDEAILTGESEPVNMGRRITPAADCKTLPNP